MKYKQWFAGALITATMITTGCSTYNPVHLRPQTIDNNYSYYQIDPPLYQGDVVEYSLKDGSHNTITVERTTPQALVADTGQVIPFEKLFSLKRKDISPGKTTAAVGAGVGATALVVAAIFTLTLGIGIAAIASGS